MSRPNILQRMQQDRLAYLQKQQRLQQTQRLAAQVQTDKRQLLAFPDLALTNKTIQISDIIPDEDRDPADEERTLVQLLSQVMSPVYAQKIARVAAVDQEDGSAAPILYLFVDNFPQYRGDLVSHFSTGRATVSSVYTWMYRWVKQRYGDEYSFTQNQAAMTDRSMSVFDRPQPRPAPKPRPLPIIREEPEPEPQDDRDAQDDPVSENQQIIAELAQVPAKEELDPETFEMALRAITTRPGWQRDTLGYQDRQARLYLVQKLFENKGLSWDDRLEYQNGFFRKRTTRATHSVVLKNIAKANLDVLLQALSTEIVGSGLRRRAPRAGPKPQQATKQPASHSRIIFGGGAQRPVTPTADKTLVKESTRWRVPSKPTVYLDLSMLDQDGKLALRYSSSKRYLISPTQLSPPGVRVVTDIVSDEFDQRLFVALPGPEKRVIERLLSLLKVSPPGYERGSTTDLHQQYQVLVGEIEAGNDNPKLKQQLRDVVGELVSLKTISVRTGKQIIAQMCS